MTIRSRELLYQQFAVQDYPIRGSVAVTASGTASWLDFLLPLTASTLHVRLLNLEDSDDFQYQVFSQDDSGSQQGLTQLYRVGDTLYLRTDVLRMCCCPCRWRNREKAIHRSTLCWRR